MAATSEQSEVGSVRPLPPVPVPGRTWWRRFTAPSQVSPQAIRTLKSMGYDWEAARRALSHTGNNLQAAIRLLEYDERVVEREPEPSSCGSSASYSSSASSTSRSETTQIRPSLAPPESVDSHTTDSHATIQEEGLLPTPQASTISKRRWFSSIGVLSPSRSRSFVRQSSGSVSTTPSIGAPSTTTCAAELHSLHSPAPSFSSLSPASDIIGTPTLPSPAVPTPAAQAVHPTVPVTVPTPKDPPCPPVAFNNTSNRRRWPLSLSKQSSNVPQDSDCVPESAEWVRVDVPRFRTSVGGRSKTKATVSTAATSPRSAAGPTAIDYLTPAYSSHPSSYNRHSVHGGPILSAAALKHLNANGPTTSLGESIAHASAHPYSRGYPFGSNTISSATAKSRNRNASPYLAVPGSLLQHPFAASLVQCNTAAQKWDDDRSDTVSDSGTFGNKGEDEYHEAQVSYWSDDTDGGKEPEDLFEDAGPNGVNVEAWRANMSTIW